MEDQTLYVHVIDSLSLTSPLLILLAAGLAVLVADIFLHASQRRMLPLIGVFGIVAAFAALHVVGHGAPGEVAEAYFGALRYDTLTFLSHNVILAVGLFLLLISPRYLEGRPIAHGEYYCLLVLAVMGMMALAASGELLALFLNIELLSITLYILAGIEKYNSRASEAAFKYFLLGSFAAAFLLFGIVFIFGATGTLRYSAIAEQLAAGIQNPLFIAVGLGLMFIGFGFKLTLAPFHMYAPDVYDGAPTPTATAIATGTKVAGFVALFHLLEPFAGWTQLPLSVWMALYAIAVISMIVGNLGAIIQPNIKRMLAYSSISHSGYTIVPMVVILRRPDLLAEAAAAVSYYLLAYTVMTLLAFGVVLAMTSAQKPHDRIADYAGLGRRAPWLAFTMTLALISLIGIPGTVGFLGKLQLFGLAVEGEHYWLAILGVLASVASAYYYLRVIVTMYMEEPAEALESPPRLGGLNTVTLGVVAVAIFLFAFFPGLYLLTQ